MTLNELFTQIADAIRAKLNSTDKIVASDFPTKIEEITGGSSDTSTNNGNFDGSLLANFNATSNNSPLVKCITKIDNLDVSSWKSTSYLFYNCENLKEIPLLNTENVETMISMFGACKNITTIPKLNTSKVKDFSTFLKDCKKLIECPELDTSSATKMESMFNGCSELETIPLFNTSNVTSMAQMFRYCSKLTEVPLLDTSKVTAMNYMFGSCYKLTRIPQFNTSKVQNFSSIFHGCTALKDVPELDGSSANYVQDMFYNSSALINFGGVKDLGKAYKSIGANNYSAKLGLNYSNNLTHDSLMNVINKLYDLNLTYGVATGGTLKTQGLTLGTTNLAKLTAEEIAIATNKGWTVN